MRNKAIIGIGLLLVTFLLINSDLVRYSLNQAYGQVKILYEARPVNEYLENPDFSREKKDKIILIEEAKKYAEDSLGIKKTKNYSKLYDDQKDTALTMWVLSACKPFQLEAYEWKFPLLGTFSYKGYFNLKHAKAEKESLDSLYYDTGIRTAGAWSTLGWFNDPIMGNLLNDSDGQIAETIIHELTHTTLYVKNDVTFNENLAVFIGHKGALKFLSKKYGEQSTQYKEYLNNWKDRQIFNDYVLNTAKELETLYNSFDSKTSDNNKKTKKELLIKSFTTGILKLDLSNKEKYFNRFKNKIPNNTFFMSYKRYNSNLKDFDKELNEKFNNNLKLFITFLKQKYTSL